MENSSNKNLKKSLAFGISIFALVVFVLLATYKINDSTPTPPEPNDYPAYSKLRVEQYKQALTNGDDAFCAYEKAQNMDSILFAERLISAETHNANREDIAAAFVPYFVNWGNDVFNGSVWKANDLNRIRAYVAKMSKFASAKGQVSSISGVLTRYDKANELLQKTWRSTDISTIKNHIADVNTYLNDGTLKNNEEQHKKLLDVKKALALAHYNAVSKHINNYVDYKYYDLNKDGDPQRKLKEINDKLNNELLDLSRMERDEYSELKIDRFSYKSLKEKKDSVISNLSDILKNANNQDSHDR